MNKKSLGLLGTVAIVIVIAIGLWLWLRPIDSSDLNNGKDSSAQSDLKPLTVSLKGVSSTELLAGTISVALNVNDLSRVARAEYYVDTVFEAVTYTYPFSFNLDTTKYTSGEHSITATIYDKDGNKYSTLAVKVKIENTSQSSEQKTETPEVTTTPSSPSSPSAATKPNPLPSGSSSSPNNTGNQTPAGDTSAPTSPSSLLLSADDGYTTNLAWTASTDNVGVSGYQVFRNGTALSAVLSSSTTSYKDQTVVPGNTYEYSVRARDMASNVSAPSNDPEITLTATSMWVDADSPQREDTSNDPYELGVRFRPLVDGKVTGVKFWKIASSTGVHEGNLWSSDGSQHLANVVFTNESSSGWQQATFDTPVTVTAGVTYVVSYTVPNGGFGYTPSYFQDGGITSEYLTALKSGIDGNNGVFNTTPGQFPGGSFNNTNYWVDATFVPNEQAGGPTVKTLDTSKVYAGFPGSNNTGVPVGKRLPHRDRSIQIYADDAILENIEISGTVDVRADNVLIRNTKVNSFVYMDTDEPTLTNARFTVRDTEIYAGAAQRGGVSLANYTLERVNIHGGQMSALCSKDCVVKDSWMHGQYVPSNQDWHLGGFLSNGGANMHLKGNTLACDTPNNDVGGGCSGALNLFGDFEPIANILIEENLILPSEGATYCVNLGYNAFKPYGPQAANIDVLNNVFYKGPGGNCAGVAVGTDYMVGGSPAPGNSWIGNTWFEDGTPIPAPF